MENRGGMLHDGCMAQVAQTGQGGNKIPGTAEPLSLALEPTTIGKVVADDRTRALRQWEQFREDNEYE